MRRLKNRLSALLTPFRPRALQKHLRKQFHARLNKLRSASALGNRLLALNTLSPFARKRSPARRVTKPLGFFSFLRLAPVQSPIRWGYTRPTQIGLTERLAERRLCAQYGWDLDLFTGKAAIRRGASAASRLRHPYPSLLQLHPKVKALRIAHWQRFGNSVLQLTNALNLAENLNVKIIEFAHPHPFFSCNRVGPYEFVHSDQPPDRATIESSFFYVDAFRLSVDTVARCRLFTDYIRPLLRPRIRDADPRVNEEDLVLHFRAGDVFSQSPPHPDYGQPPLSFYLAVVEREKPARVWLVSEDRGNLCVDAVESALHDRGIEVIPQSAALEDDIRLLLSARRLVVSRGTFAHMIAHLSERLQRLYFFESSEENMEVLRALGVEIVRVIDIKGEFKAKVLTEWRGSSEQRALMFSYSAENLAFIVDTKGEALKITGSSGR